MIGLASEGDAVVGGCGSHVSRNCTRRPALCVVGARASVGRYGPSQWTGRYYKGAFSRGPEPTLARGETELSAASVPLPAKLVAILRRHRLNQFGDTQVARANTLRRAGVPSIRLHDLRHSCATSLFAMGVEAATVRRILPHSSISVTTATYVDVIEQVQRSAVAGIDSPLNPAM